MKGISGVDPDTSWVEPLGQVFEVAGAHPIPLDEVDASRPPGRGLQSKGPRPGEEIETDRARQIRLKPVK